MSDFSLIQNIVAETDCVIFLSLCTFNILFTRLKKIFLVMSTTLPGYFNFADLFSIYFSIREKNNYRSELLLMFQIGFR